MRTRVCTCTYRLHTEVYIVGCCVIYMTEGHRPEAHVNNKATYTEVCNLLVPRQQEMQLSQELLDCTCILRATCKKLLEITRKHPDLHENL